MAGNPSVSYFKTNDLAMGHWGTDLRSRASRYFCDVAARHVMSYADALNFTVGLCFLSQKNG